MSDPVISASAEMYDTLCREYSAQKAYRKKVVESGWRDSIQLVLPMYGEFGPEQPWPDLRYDSIGTDCVEQLGDGMFSNLTPAGKMWFRYEFLDEESNKSSAGGSHLEALTQHMVNVFNKSTYYDIGPELLQIGIGVGSATLDIHEEKGEERIILQPEHPRAAYAVSDARGQVNKVFIEKYFKADQAIDEYGEENVDETMKQAQKNGDTTEFLFVECVMKNPDAVAGSRLAEKWPFREYTFTISDAKKKFVRVAGAHTFSKPTWRWKTRGSNPYGWAPVNTAMPDIRTCNQMVRTMLLNLQKQADPATFDPQEGRNWSRNPGTRNFYTSPERRGYNDQVPNAYPYVERGLELLQKRVRMALKVDAFLMLMQIEAQMTAREVVERKREGLSIVSATVGKFETEELDQIHARCLAIEAAAGRLPKPPKELIGKDLKVRYLGPISQMQREIFVEQGIVSALETAVIVFKIWPESTQKIKGGMLIDRIWKANNAPEDALRNDKEYAQALQKIEDAQAAAAQAQQMAEVGKNIDPMQAPQPGSPAEMMQRGSA